MLSRIPMPTMHDTRLDPPTLMKGKVIPVYGMVAVTTAILTSA